MSRRRLKSCTMKLAVVLMFGVLSTLHRHCDAQAKVRLSGLQNCSSYKRTAEYFVQIQNEGMHMKPIATGGGGAQEPSGLRVSDRVMVTHDGWPSNVNAATSQSVPGLHTLDLKVITFRSRQAEPQTLLSQEAFASTSTPLCDGADADAQRRCENTDQSKFGTKLPFRQTSQLVDMEVVESNVQYTVLDNMRGVTEWGLPPWHLQQRRPLLPGSTTQRPTDASSAAADDGDVDEAAANSKKKKKKKKSSVFQLKAPSMVPYAATATATAAAVADSAADEFDPVVRIPVGVSHLWPNSGGDFVRDNVAVALELQAFAECGAADQDRAAPRPIGHHLRQWVHIQRGAGQALVHVHGSDLFTDGWRWWSRTGSAGCRVSVSVRMVKSCANVAAKSRGRRLDGDEKEEGGQGEGGGEAEVCHRLLYPGAAQVRLVPWSSPSGNNGNSDDDGAAAAAAAAGWQLLHPTVDNSRVVSFGDRTRQLPALVAAIEGPVTIGNHAVVDIAPGSLLVIGPGVDIHVREGASLRIGAHVDPVNAQSPAASFTRHYVSTTLVTGVPHAGSSAATTTATATPLGASTSVDNDDEHASLRVSWGGIYAVGYASTIDVGTTQVIDAGRGLAGNWQLSQQGHGDGSGAHGKAGLPHDAGPAHLQVGLAPRFRMTGNDPAGSVSFAAHALHVRAD